MVAASLNEGFGLPLVEAARFGKPIIARDIPVFREIADGYAQFFDSATPEELADVLESWLERLGNGSLIHSKDLKVLTWQHSTENLKRKLISAHNSLKQLMVDVSELVQRDAATGIQRVVKNICREWLKHPPAGYRVELVYATHGRGYKYAKRFESALTKNTSLAVQDDYIEFKAGDYFFGLDLQPTVQAERQEQILEMQRLGVIVKFMVYDLLPVTSPQFFPGGAERAMTNWLSLVARANGAVCISETTATELTTWIRANEHGYQQSCHINHIHLGSDFDKGFKNDEFEALRNHGAGQRHSSIRFLMVGTIEPRKGHSSILDAFDIAWEKGLDLHLCFIGKKGWMSRDLEHRILNHQELDRRLFWLSAATDSELEYWYLYSDCLIAASYGEGFGLPIVEAAARGLPIIARDIPVFREVAGTGAYYFKGTSSKLLFKELSQWIKLFRAEQHPKCDQISLVTWEHSARDVFAKLTDESSG